MMQKAYGLEEVEFILIVNGEPTASDDMFGAVLAECFLVAAWGAAVLRVARNEILIFGLGEITHPDHCGGASGEGWAGGSELAVSSVCDCDA